MTLHEYIRHAWDHHTPTITAAVSATSGSAAIVMREDFWYLWFGVQQSVLLASFCGAAFALSFLPTMGFIRAVLSILFCTLLAAYIVPLFAWTFDIPDRLSLGLAATIGLASQTAFGAVLTMLPDLIRQAAQALIARIKGKS